MASNDPDFEALVNAPPTATAPEPPATDSRKRKSPSPDHKEAAKPKKQKQEVEKERPKTAVYVTGFPRDATVEEVNRVFSRCGVIAESADTNEPRIKLYKNEKGELNGDGLIVFFRPESVQLAIDILDETDFRFGEPVIEGPMRVKVADSIFKVQQDTLVENKPEEKKVHVSNKKDKQKFAKKKEQMNKRLADWDDDYESDPGTLPTGNTRWDKTVVLKRMFTLHELETDPDAEEDIVDDIREECEKYGTVTRVKLFNAQPNGVVTVKFEDVDEAQACVKAFTGRIFAGRTVEVSIADGKERFKMKKKTQEDEER